MERGHHMKMNVLTYEGEYEGEDEEHSIAVHCERESKVSSQAAPSEELVHCRPIVGVQAQLEETMFSCPYTSDQKS